MKENVQEWMGEGHDDLLQPCSLSAGGSCGQQQMSSRTRQCCKLVSTLQLLDILHINKMGLDTFVFI